MDEYDELDFYAYEQRFFSHVQSLMTGKLHLRPLPKNIDENDPLVKLSIRFIKGEITEKEYLLAKKSL